MVLLTKGRDLVKIYEDKNMPRPLSDKDRQDLVKDAILKEEVN